MNLENNEVVEKKPLGNMPSGTPLGKIVAGLEKFSAMVNGATHQISKVILFLLMILTTVDVIGRNFFNSPITGTYELTGLGVALMVFFSLGITQMTGEHITIDFLTAKFPVKLRAVINGISFLIIIVLLALTSWQSVEYMKRIMAGNQTTADLSIPLYYFVLIATIGMILFAIAILVDFFKSLQKVVEKNES